MSQKMVIRRLFGLFVILSLLFVAFPVMTTQAADIHPNATYSIGGTIQSGYSWYYGSYYETSGSQMTTRITWNPSTSSVKLGLCTSANYSSCTWSSAYSGGAASKTWTISSSGNYYLGILNVGPETINFSGYIDV